MRLADEYKSTANPFIYKRLHLKKHLSCDRCPPHRFENGNYVKPRKKKEFQLRRLGKRVGHA